MRSLPHEAQSEDALCSTLLRIVQDHRKIEQLREHLGGFSHRCRNLLNGMKMSLYLVRREAEHALPAWWADLEQSYGGIELLLERLQVIYRPMTLTLVRARFASLVQDHKPLWRDYFETSGRSLEFATPGFECPCAFDPMLLSGGLDAFLRWRSAAMPPDYSARLSWRTSATDLELCWNETANEMPSTVTQRSAPTSSEHALALPLLARIIGAHHGAVQLHPRPEFGLLITCPLSQPEAVMAP